MKFANLVPELLAQQGDGFWYLASVYNKFPMGGKPNGDWGEPDSLQEAFEEACLVAMRLLEAGVNVFCPIAHTHPIGNYAKRTTPNTHEFWVDQVDAPLIRAARGIIVTKMPNWKISVGINMERREFALAGKPEFMLDWPVE